MKIVLRRSVEYNGLDAIVLPVFKGRGMVPVFQEYPELEGLFRRLRYTGQAGQDIVFFSSRLQCMVMVVGMGTGDTGRLGDIVKCTKKLWALVEQYKVKKALCQILQEVSLSSLFWRGFIDFLYLGAYRFDRYMKRKAYVGLKELGIYVVAGGGGAEVLEPLLGRQELIGRGVVLARDLVNEPAAVLNPDTLVAEFEALAREFSQLQVTVWRGRELVGEGMQGILTVGKASPYEPALVRVVYRPADALKTVALVGKGITFDAGGLNIKTGNAMMEMKCDMGGAAAVLGVMSVLPGLGLPVAVEALVPIAENMVAATGYKPGDIITFKNKKTVEVVNTDSEGRLLLADALIAAVALRPDYIVELSTLTGGVISALGDSVAGVMGNHKRLLSLLLRAGQRTGERLWQLPLVEDYRDSIKSKVADLKNCGYGPPQSIKAALFLKEFVAGLPFAHLDIAGTAFLTKPAGFYLREGATGFGVRLLCEFLALLVGKGADEKK